MAQAGLSTAPSGGSLQAGLGDTGAPRTMLERYKTYQSLVGQGVPEDQARGALGWEVESPAAEPEDDGYTLGDKIEYTARNTPSLFLEGVGKRTGLDWLSEFGEGIAPDEDLERERAEDRAARQQAVADGEMSAVGAKARDIRDGVIETGGSLAGSMAAGAAAGAPFGGPVGAGIGAALGAAAFGVGSAYGEVYRGAEADGLDVNDPQVKAAMDTTALSMGALDAIGAFKLLKMFNPKAAKSIIKKYGMKGIASKGLKEGGGGFLVEGLTEASQEALQAVLMDPEVVSKLSYKDKLELAPQILKEHGPEFLDAFLIGGVLGGGVGTAGGSYSAVKENSDLAKDTQIGAAVAKELSIPDSGLQVDPKDQDAVNDLRGDLTTLRRQQEVVDNAKEILDVAERSGDVQATAKAAEAYEQVQRKLNATKDAFAKKRGGLTRQEATKQTETEGAERSAAITERIKKAGLDVKKVDDLAAGEKHAVALETAQNKVRKAADRLAATEAAEGKSTPERRKQLRKAIKAEAEAQDAAAVELEGRKPRERFNERMSTAAAEERAVERGAVKTKFAEQDWADAEQLTPEEVVERADRIIGGRKPSKEADQEAKKKIAALKARRDRSTSPEQYDTLQREIDAKQADLNAETPRVEVAREVKRAAQAEIESQTAEAEGKSQQSGEVPGPVQQPTTPEAEAGPGSAEEGSAQTVEGEPATADEPSTAATPSVEPRNVSDAAKKGLAAARKAYKAAPSPEAEAAIDQSARRVLQEAGIAEPTDGQVAAFRAGERKSVSQRVMRAALVKPETVAPDAGQAETVTEVAEPPAEPTSEAGEAPTSPAPSARTVPDKVPSNNKLHDGYDFGKQGRWVSVLSETNANDTLEAHEEFLRAKTAEGKRKVEYSAAYDADGTIRGMGTNNNENGVMPPKMNFQQPGGTFTHTHPFRTPMSGADVLAMSAGRYGRFRAVLPDQTVEMGPGARIGDVRRDALERMHMAIADQIEVEPALEGMQALDTVGRARILQEAMLQHLHLNDYIDYRTPMEGFSATERSMIDEVLEAYGELEQTGRGADAAPGTGARTDVGLRAGEAGEGGRRSGERGAVSAPDVAAGLDPEEAVYPDIVRGILAGTPTQDLLQTPEFQGAVGRMMTMPPTHTQEGFWSPEWQAQRAYEINGETVIGAEAASVAMLENAINLAAIETKQPVQAPATDRQLTIITGPPASGKSTIANRIAYQNKAAIIDSDEAKKVIPEFGTGEGANAVHEESKLLMEPVEEELMKAGVNVVYPKVGHTKSSIDKLAKKFEDAGYTVKLVDLKVDTPEAMRRMVTRFGMTGRLIPPSYLLEEVRDRPAITHQDMAQEGRYDGYAQLDGMVAFGETPTVISQRGNDPLAGTDYAVQPGQRAERGPDGGAAEPEDAGSGAEQAPIAAEGIDPDVRQKTRPRSADPERVGEMAVAAHQRLGDVRAPRNPLQIGIKDGTITPEHLSNAFMEAAGNLDRELAGAVDSMADALYPDANIRETLDDAAPLLREMEAGWFPADETLQNARVAALRALNEFGAEIGVDFEADVATARSRDTKKPISVSILRGSRKLRDAIGAEPPTTARFAGPGSFDPDDTTGIKMKPSNIMSGAALERAKSAARILQRNEYRIVPERLAALTHSDFLDGRTDEQVLEDEGPAGKFLINGAKAKLKRLKALVEQHRKDFGADAPIMFRWRLDDKGRMYADGEFTPQVGETVKYLFSGNGQPLTEMWEVDHTGSGWQIAAMAARDDVFAPVLNIQGGQLGTEAPVRGDIYVRTQDALAEVINKDAAMGDPRATVAQTAILSHPEWVGGNGRKNIKPAVIAVNYAGGGKNFRDALEPIFDRAVMDASNGKPPQGMWSYIGDAGMRAIEEAGPATARMKNWSINALKAAIGAANEAGFAEDLTFTVGRETKFAKLRPQYKEDTFRVQDRRPEAAIQGASRAKGRKIPTADIDINGSARTIFSQIIQGYDAAILHEAVNRFGEANPGVFITPNHDSYTLPPEHAPEISRIVREVMAETMGETDMVQRLYDEVVEQVGVEAINDYAERNNLAPVEPFDGYGDYDPQDILTAIPMWAEGKSITEEAYGAEKIPPETKPEAAQAIDFSQMAPVKQPRGETYQGVRERFTVENTNEMAPKKALILNKTNAKNADAQSEALDVLAERHPNPLASEEAWVAMMNDAFGTSRVAMPPWQTMNIIREDGQPIVDQLKGMDPGMIKDAKEGLRTAKAMGAAYRAGRATPADTASLFMWSFLSRGVSPYVQEAAFLDAVISPEFHSIVDAASREGWSDALAARYSKWASKAIPEGSPGKGTTHNLNAFGKNFLKVMSQKWEDGRSGLQMIHDMIADGAPSKEIRRTFLKVGENAGIDNKVVSFTLLLTGRDDVLVLDRIQMRNQWDDGRFNRENIYDDKFTEDGKQIAGSGISHLSFNHKGLLFYENMEKALEPVVKSAYAKMGRGEGSLGRYHWDSWLASSNQEVGHSSVEGLLKTIDGDPQGYTGTFVRQGKYNGYDYGFRYTVMPDGSRAVVVDSTVGVPYVIPAAELGTGKPLHKAFSKLKTQAKRANERAGASIPWASALNETQKGTYDATLADLGTPAPDVVANATDATGYPSGSGATDPVAAAALDTATLERARAGGRRRAGEPGDAAYADDVRVGGRDAGRQSRPAEGIEYADAMQAAAGELGPAAAQVSRVDPDADVQRFLLDGGATGYALDGDNIVGVFSTPSLSPKGAAQRVLQDAVARGGRRLDGFDTYLPGIYAGGGFRAVARLPFDPEYAPTAEGGALADWDAAAMDQISEGWGSPDVVFMVYDPENAGPDTDNRITEYEEGEAAQREALTGAREPLPAAARDVISAPEGVKLMDETSSVMNAVIGGAKDPVGAYKGFWNTVEDKFFNGLAPIRRLEVATRGELGVGAESAYKAAEMAINDSGRSEALMWYGAAKLGEHGEFQHAPGTVGLRTIFDTAVGDKKGAEAGQTMSDWMGWMVAKRIQELRSNGQELDFPMKDLEAALAKEQPQFAEAQAMWRAHNNANIDFLVDTGRISEAQAAGLKEAEYYVPFYRSEDNADGSAPDFVFPDGYERRGRGGSAGTLLSRDPGIKKLIGGDKKLIDNIMKNMIRNSQSMTAAGMRNQAANQIFELMGEANLAKTVKARKKGKNGNWVQVEKPSEHAVKIWVKGKEKWALPEGGAEPYLVAMAGLQPLQLKGIVGQLASIAAIFRQGITLSPSFMVRNLIRGMVANGLLTSGANLTLSTNTMTGMRDAYGNGQATQAFKAMSGMGDFRFGNSDRGFGRNDILMEYGMLPKTFAARVRSAINRAEHLGTATELADRVAAFQTMQRNGIRADEAAYQALAVMNYARKGGLPQLRQFLPLVPFLNARMQGLSRLTEGAVGRRGPEGRRAAMGQLAINGAILGTISAALWAWNGMDEEREERYKSEPLYRRLNYHIFYVGDTAFYIPKAFELGHLFSSIPELFLDAAVRDMNEVVPGVKKILADTLMFNAIPAGILPVIEGKANYSFFRQAPIVGQREQNLRPEDRVTGSSTLARFIGRQLGVSDMTTLSPTMIEHYLQGFGGAYFHMMSGATDMAAAELGFSSAPVGGAWGDTPVASQAAERVFGSMIKRSDQQSSKYMEEFYRNKDYITQIYRSAKAAAASGDVEYAQRLLQQAGGTPAAYKLVNKAASQLSDLNAAIRAIRQDTKMSPGAKRTKIEPLIRARNELVRGVAGVIRDIEEAQGATFKGVA